MPVLMEYLKLVGQKTCQPSYDDQPKPFEEGTAACGNVTVVDFGEDAEVPPSLVNEMIGSIESKIHRLIGVLQPVLKPDDGTTPGVKASGIPLLETLEGIDGHLEKLISRVGV